MVPYVIPMGRGGPIPMGSRDIGRGISDIGRGIGESLSIYESLCIPLKIGSGLEIYASDVYKRQVGPPLPGRRSRVCWYGPRSPICAAGRVVSAIIASSSHQQIRAAGASFRRSLGAHRSRGIRPSNLQSRLRFLNVNLLAIGFQFDTQAPSNW